MSVFTLRSVQRAHDVSVKLSAAKLRALPSEYTSAEAIEAAGGKLGKQGATLPLAGIRHLDAGCGVLAASLRESGAQGGAAMYRNANTAALRRATMPCPECFPAEYARQGERATKRGKLYSFDAASGAMRAVDAPTPTPRKRRGKVAAK